MGQGVSSEQISAHLERQDALVKQLQAVVDKQAKSLESMGAAVDYDQDGKGKGKDAPDYLDDELRDLSALARNAERKRKDEPVDDEEKAAGNAEWSEPSEEEERGFMATKPWLGSMAPPTGWEYGKTDAAPDVNLELEHVYGFRSIGVRNNVFWVDSNTILYFAAGVGIVHNIATNRQKFFRGHTDDIISIAYHPEKRVVATGEQGKFPSICVWDVDTCQQLAQCVGFHQRAVCSVAFSKDGSRVASVGMDNEHSIAVYDWASGALVASGKGDTNRILGIMRNDSADADPQNDFVTVGVKHIRFWKVEGSRLTGKKGLLGNLGEYQTFLVAAFTNLFTVVGTAGGELYCFKGNKLTKVIDAHQKAIYSLRGQRDTIYSGGRDGYVSKWNMNTLKKELSVNINKIEAPEVLRAHTNSVRAVDILDNDVILAGTLTGTINRVDMASGSVKTMHYAHYGDLSVRRTYGELWGLCPGPNGQLFLTAGEDSTLRLWNAAERRMEAKVMVSARAQSVAWSPNGKFVACGLQDGTLVVLNDKLEEVKSVKKGPRRVQCVKFSPNSEILVAGTADNVVNMFDATKDFKYTGKLTGNSSVILSVDFSEDGEYIQTCSQSYELLFYEVKSGKQYTRSRELKDVKWASFSSILGWDVQGIWPRESDGSEVNAVNRSNGGKYLATGGDTGEVKVFQYPCVGGGLNKRGKLVRRPESNVATGHSEHVTEVAWTSGDERLLSAGGGDLSCFQWKVVKA